MNADSIEWKNFELSVNLLKTYLDLAIKLNLFHYAITGAILSFYFSKENTAVFIYSLILPTEVS